MTSNRTELGDLIEGFKLTCQTEGKSPRTIEWYTAFLIRFLSFLRSRSRPTDLRSLSNGDVKGFVRYLQTEARTARGDKPLAGATVQGYVRTLKAFFSWAEREGYVSPGQLGRLLVPKARSKVISTFAGDQLGKLISMCQASGTEGQRNLAMLMLFLDTGMRVSELISIRLCDVNLTEGSVIVRVAKGGRERVVPIGSLVQKSLWKYTTHYRPEPLTRQINSLFLSKRGLPLTKSGVQQMIRRYGARAGVTGVRCSPHTFRHSFARDYLLNGGDIFSLQKILGHSSLASVRTYLNLFAADVKKQHMRFSPVDNLAREPGFRGVSFGMRRPR